MTPQSLPIVALCAGLCISGSREEQSVALVFAPGAGTELEKVFDAELEFGVEKLTWNYDGYEMDVRGFVPLGAGIVSRLRVIDEYTAVEGGRPIALERWYDDIATEWDWRKGREVLNPMLNRAVTFTWDDDWQEYDVAWARESRYAPADLERLYEDLDLRRLLPIEDAWFDGESLLEPGDHWSVPFARLAPVVMPGGDIHRQSRYWSDSGLAAAQERSGKRLREWILGGGLEGELECELVRVYEVDGRTLAEVALEVDWHLWRDLTGVLETWDSPFGSADFDRVFVDLDARGEGWLVWDTTRNHFESFELDLVVDFDVELDLGYFGTSGTIETEGEVRGRWTAEAENLTDC